MNDEYRWFIVVDDAGNCDEVFNSRAGAEGWAAQAIVRGTGAYTVVEVKEVKNDTKN